MISILKNIAFTAFLIAAGAHAQEGGNKSFVNGLLGYSIITSGEGGNDFMYSARAGHTVHSDDNADLSIGLYLGRISSELTVGGVKVGETITALTAEVLARNAFGTGFYYGARAGLGLVGATVESAGDKVSGSGNSFIIGPAFGYEFSVNEKVTINTDLAWLSLSGGSLNFSGIGEVEYESASAITMQVGASYHF